MLKGFFAKKKPSLVHFLVFCCLITAISFFYGYHDLIYFEPCSNHCWRQGDNASLVLNYYQDGMDFFHPRIHNEVGWEGSRDCVAEFPAFYYSIAVLYKLFGPHDLIFRLVVWLSLIAGLFVFSKILLRLTGDIVWALAWPMLFLGSPVLAFYGFNFLTDIPALGLTLIGWGAFAKYRSSGKVGWLYLMTFIFLNAGLLKITALISFLAIAGAMFLDLLIKLLRRKRPDWKTLHLFAGLVVLVGVTAWWYRYAIQYNLAHQSAYFSTHIWPIWNMSKAEILDTLHVTWVLWRPEYFRIEIHLMLITMGFWVLFKPRKDEIVLYLAYLIGIVGVVLFVFMWFLAFRNHDYYILNLLIIPLAAIILFSKPYKMLKAKLAVRKWPLWVFYGILGALVIVNAAYAKKKLGGRYNPRSWYMDAIRPVYYDPELRPFLAEQGLVYPERVISIPDFTSNTTLYLMNLTGETELYHPEGFTSEKVKEYAGKGIHYLIIGDTTYLAKPELQEVMAHPVSNFKGQLFIYDLGPFAAQDTTN